MFQISKEDEEWRAKVREYAQKVIRPRAHEIDAKGEFPIDLIKEMGRMGIMGMIVPKEWGGPGISTIAYAMGVEEISRVCGSTGITVAAHNSLCTGHINLAGSPEQKEKYLRKLATGEYIGAWGLTEPGAGSDAGGVQTFAVRDGDGWRINGQKLFITNGHIADVFVIMAKTDPEKGSKGISAFVFPRGTKGLKMGKMEEKLGLKGSITSQFFIEDMWLPDDALLGQRGNGFRDALTILDSGRISIGSLALGLAQGALDATLEYARTHIDLRKPENEWINFTIADMATEIEAARLLIYNAAWLKDMKKPMAKEASIAKLYASEVGTRCAIRAINILGPAGCTKEYPVERILRDVKLCEIGEGTSEIQRIVIARQLGL